MADLLLKLAPIRDAARAGRFEQAKQSLLRLAQQHPGSIEVASMLSRVLGSLNQHVQAEHYAKRTLALLPNPDQQPRSAEEATELAEIAAMAGDLDRAGRWIEAAIPFDPASLGRHVLAARFYANRERYLDCCRVCAGSLKQFPHEPELTMLFANSLRFLTRQREAVELYRHALRAHPESLNLAVNYATTLNYLPGIEPSEILAAHIAAAQIVEREAGPELPPPDARGDGPIRIGFVSGDLRTHAVSLFLEPILEHLPRETFSVTCYSVTEQEDAMSRALAKLTTTWRHVPTLDPRRLAEQIRADRIDVLVDLSGFTAGNRMKAFALRPARSQVTYIGYPNTTGLAAMHVRLADSITDPPETASASRTTTETLVRLDPCFLCFAPPKHAPACSAPPSETSGGITFGSFNISLKIHEGLIAAWADLVNSVPGSRFLLKPSGAMDPASLKVIAERFAAAGLARDRLELLGFMAATGDHLGAYSRVDIALDTFPYNGTTTTCEAMYMGVPVVCLRGAAHASRVGVSLLTQVGLPGLIGADLPEYLAIARTLAADRPTLRTLRATLRDRVLASPLCDAPAMAERFAVVMMRLADGPGQVRGGFGVASPASP